MVQVNPVIDQAIEGIGGQMGDVLCAYVLADQRFVFQKNAFFNTPAHPQSRASPVHRKTEIVNIGHFSEQHGLDGIFPDKGDLMLEFLMVGTPVSGIQKDLSRLRESIASHQIGQVVQNEAVAVQQVSMDAGSPGHSAG